MPRAPRSDYGDERRIQIHAWLDGWMVDSEPVPRAFPLLHTAHVSPPSAAKCQPVHLEWDDCDKACWLAACLPGLPTMRHTQQLAQPGCLVSHPRFTCPRFLLAGQAPAFVASGGPIFFLFWCELCCNCSLLLFTSLATYLCSGCVLYMPTYIPFATPLCLVVLFGCCPLLLPLSLSAICCCPGCSPAHPHLARPGQHGSLFSPLLLNF